MKKISFFLFSFLLSVTMFSQETQAGRGLRFSGNAPLNEVKVNLPWTIFGSYPEISYERILQSDISVGVTVGVGLDTDQYPYEYAFTPHFRWFFGGNRESMRKYAAGFFIEANGSVYSQVIDTGTVPEEVSETGAGLGLALGWKYVTRNNWVGDIVLGGGRNFIKNDYDAVAYPRFGISIGKRF